MIQINALLMNNKPRSPPELRNFLHFLKFDNGTHERFRWRMVLLAKGFALDIPSGYPLKTAYFCALFRDATWCDRR
jgi:hypothetical protein